MDCFEFVECFWVVVDCVLQFCVCVVDCFCVDEDCWDVCVDYCYFQCVDVWYCEIVDEVVGWEYCVVCVFFFCGWIYEFELYFGGWECDVVQFEVVCFLYCVVCDWYMGDDCFVDVCLLDLYGCDVIVWYVCWIDQFVVDCEWVDCC